MQQNILSHSTQKTNSNNQYYYSLDILKCFAVFLVINSHMQNLYPESITFLSKIDGQFANGLFFFCTGFTLLKKNSNLSFGNWYKRRIQRIYPTVIVWSILLSTLWGKDLSIIETILHGGGWFISCIMIYYIFIFFLQKMSERRLWFLLFFIAFISSIWYIFFEKDKADISIFNTLNGTTAYIIYFSSVILGGITQKTSFFTKKKTSQTFFLFFFSYFLLNLIRFTFNKQQAYPSLQLTCIIPYWLSIYFFFLCITKPQIINFFKKKYLRTCILFISSIALEIYIVQYYCFIIENNELFPLNLLFNTVAIIFVAYLTHSASRLFLNIFREAPLDWQYIFSPLKSKIRNITTHSPTK